MRRSESERTREAGVGRERERARAEAARSDRDAPRRRTTASPPTRARAARVAGCVVVVVVVAVAGVLVGERRAAARVAGGGAAGRGARGERGGVREREREADEEQRPRVGLLARVGPRPAQRRNEADALGAREPVAEDGDREQRARGSATQAAASPASSATRASSTGGLEVASRRRRSLSTQYLSASAARADRCSAGADGANATHTKKVATRTSTRTRGRTCAREKGTRARRAGARVKLFCFPERGTRDKSRTVGARGRARRAPSACGSARRALWARTPRRPCRGRAAARAPRRASRSRARRRRRPRASASRTAARRRGRRGAAPPRLEDARAPRAARAAAKTTPARVGDLREHARAEDGRALRRCACGGARAAPSRRQSARSALFVATTTSASRLTSTVASTSHE